MAIGITAFLESNGPYLLTVSCNCMLNIWNIKEERNLHQQNIQSLFSDPDAFGTYLHSL